MYHITPSPLWTTIDNSKILTHQRCPREYFWNYILGWRKDNHNIHLVAGQAWHKAMEYLRLHGCNMDNFTGAWEEYMAVYRPAFPIHMDESFTNKSPANMQQALVGYINHHALFDEYEAVEEGVEIPAIAPISDTFNICGRIDWLARRKADGKLVIIDYKTAGRDDSCWRAQWALNSQMSTYIHMARCFFDFDAVWGAMVEVVFLRYSKTGKGMGNTFDRVPVRRTRDEMQFWLDTTKVAVEDIQRDMDRLAEATPVPTTMPAFAARTNNCSRYNSMCPYHSLCVNCPNPLRLLETLPQDTAPMNYRVEFWNPLEHEETKPAEPTVQPITIKAN